MQKNIGICSKNYILSVVELEKKVVTPVNDKFWILKDGINYLPYNHGQTNVIKKFVANGMTLENAKKRAMELKLKPKIESLIEEHINL